MLPLSVRLLLSFCLKGNLSRSTFLSVCLKAPAYLHPDSVKRPCWLDSRLSTPLSHKPHRGTNVVPLKMFQGRSERYKTAELRCCLHPLFYLAVTVFFFFLSLSLPTQCRLKERTSHEWQAEKLRCWAAFAFRV